MDGGSSDKARIPHCGCTLESSGEELRNAGAPPSHLEILDLGWCSGICVLKLSLCGSSVWPGLRLPGQVRR